MLRCLALGLLLCDISLCYLPPTSTPSSLVPYRSFVLENPSAGIPVLATTTTSHLQRAFVCRLLSEDDAKYIVSEAEAHVHKGGVGWSTDRHAAYPTTDFAVDSCPTIHKFITPVLETRILPGIAQLYGVDKEDLQVDDLFVVKYDSRAQAALPLHYDETLISFSVLLSDPNEFIGGGTRFCASTWVVDESQGAGEPMNLVKPSFQGDLFVHCGRLTHEGVRVTSGVRYLLVGFVHVAAARSNHHAHREYLCGMGRLTHLKRLSRGFETSMNMRNLKATGQRMQRNPSLFMRRLQKCRLLRSQAQLEFQYTQTATSSHDGSQPTPLIH